MTSSAIVTHQTDPSELRTQADNRLLVGHTTDSLIAAAFAKSVDDPVFSDRLVALFRRRSEAAFVAAAALIKNGPQRRVTNALAVADTPQALTALTSLARNSSLSENIRVDSLLAFLEIQHPDVDSMRAPAGLVRDPDPIVRSAARLISGAMARAGRASHAAESEAIETSLITLYRDSHDTQEEAELLRALGNSASLTVVPAVEGALADVRAPIRLAAVCALRLAPGSDVDELLAHLISSDSDPAVRSEAIFAARFRRPLPPAIVDSLLHAASNDVVDYVRSNAVSLLRQNPSASPEIADALARIAERDSNPSIRREASHGLASKSAPSL